MVKEKKIFHRAIEDVLRRRLKPWDRKRAHALGEISMVQAKPAIRRIAVYCGSSGDVPGVYRSAARDFGALLAEEGIGLVYGGGRVGLMGIVADAALECGGEVIGVIPHRLQELELGHEGVTELVVTSTMAERKVKMQELSQAAVALPGGPGTLDELFEEMVLTQLCYQSKPVGLLNVDGYYDHLLAFMEHMASQGFVRAPFDKLLNHGATPESLLGKIQSYEGYELNLKAKLEMAGRLSSD